MVEYQGRRKEGSTHRTTENVPLAYLISDQHMLTDLVMLKYPVNPPQTVRNFRLGQIKAWFNKTYV